MKDRCTLTAGVLVAVLLGPSSAVHAADYLREIKPLLRERCVSCHGSVKQKGDLRLDAGSLISTASHAEILTRIGSNEKDERMPPDGARLSSEQVALLREWFAAGAPYPPDEAVPRPPREHWSFQPVKRPPMPSSIHEHPVDAFLFGNEVAPPPRGGSRAAAPLASRFDGTSPHAGRPAAVRAEA